MTKLLNALVLIALLPVAWMTLNIVGLIIWFLLVLSTNSYLNQQELKKEIRKAAAKAAAQAAK